MKKLIIDGILKEKQLSIVTRIKSGYSADIKYLVKDKEEKNIY